uniref:Uncharacterized protein n=1 Tax=Lepeophtheirus salmonis TaxID=72036 RepID=A0A0K2VHV9_LEPSM
MDDFSESTFWCDVLLVSLSKVPYTEKSSVFKSVEEGAISLRTGIEPSYLCIIFGTWRTCERVCRPEPTHNYSTGSWFTAIAR